MRIAIITGASSGMGREFAKQIETKCYLDEIWLIGRNEERLIQVGKELSTASKILPMDLCDKEKMKEFRCMLDVCKPTVRFLVNSAGFGSYGLMRTLSKKEQLHMIETNVTALTKMTFFCLPYMKRGSRIIELASAAAFAPQPRFGVYAATKSYVLSFAASLYEEEKKREIYVTAVCPGPVDTAFFDHMDAKEGMLGSMRRANPRLVVKKALLDSKKKRRISVYGSEMMVGRFFAKLLPMSIVTKVLFKLGENGERK